MKMEEIHEIMAAFVKRNDASLHITVLVSFKMKADIKSKEKPFSPQASDVQKECRMVIARLELERQLAALCRRRWRTKLTRQVEELETSREMERDFLLRGATGNALEKQE